ncbi:MAG: hypothetical protein H0X70_09075 [Segetibacter sp.]|nr:hypothetical protein [Segetibacter sp.]
MNYLHYCLHQVKKILRKRVNLKVPQTKVFDGKADSWLKTNGDGSPKQLGITIDAAAFNSLPGSAKAEEHNFNSAFILSRTSRNQTG